jgi:hypothetical protein
VSLRKPSTREGLACALLSEKGIESRKACVCSKVEHPFLIVKRRFDPLKEALQEDREDLLYARVFLALANLTHVHLLPAGCTFRLPASLDPSWSLIAVHAAG